MSTPQSSSRNYRVYGTRSLLILTTIAICFQAGCTRKPEGADPTPRATTASTSSSPSSGLSASPSAGRPTPGELRQITITGAVDRTSGIASPGVDLKIEGPFAPTAMRGELFAQGIYPVHVVVSAPGPSGPVDLALISLPEAPFEVKVDLRGSGEDEIIVTNTSFGGAAGTRVRFSPTTFTGTDGPFIRKARQRSMDDVEVKVSGREVAQVKCPIDRECEIRFEFRR